MPLLAHLQNAEADAQILLWAVEEPESAFQHLVFTPAERDELAGIHHPDKRRQWLAARHCLHQLLGLDSAYLRKDAQGRPYCVDDKWFVSLSHTEGYAAAIVSPRAKVGIDIETLGRRTDFAVSRMFMDAEERATLDSLQGLEAERYFFSVWCAKEAVFKLHALKGANASFKGHFHTRIQPADLALPMGRIRTHLTYPGLQGIEVLPYWRDPNVLLVYGVHPVR